MTSYLCAPTAASDYTSAQRLSRQRFSAVARVRKSWRRKNFGGCPGVEETYLARGTQARISPNSHIRRWAAARVGVMAITRAIELVKTGDNSTPLFDDHESTI